MHERTVVAWDGGTPSDRAVAWAVERVRGSSDRLLIVRVIDDASLYMDELDTKRRVALATFAIAELAARLRTENPGIEITTVVAQGEPGETLAARSDATTLLVVGGEHGATEDYWYSSRMGERLAATATGPVAIIPVEDDHRRSGVVVGVDDSRLADHLVLAAAEIAERRGEPLLIVHAGSELPGEVLDPDDAGDEAETALDEVLELVESTHPELRVERHIAPGPAAANILRLARDASHVVVGTRRPGVLRRLFLGSVSRTVVNNARCPTIVIPPEPVGVERAMS